MSQQQQMNVNHNNLQCFTVINKSDSNITQLLEHSSDMDQQLKTFKSTSDNNMTLSSFSTQESEIKSQMQIEQQFQQVQNNYQYIDNVGEATIQKDHQKIQNDQCMMEEEDSEDKENLPPQNYNSHSQNPMEEKYINQSPQKQQNQQDQHNFIKILQYLKRIEVNQSKFGLKFKQQPVLQFDSRFSQLRSATINFVIDLQFKLELKCSTLFIAVQQFDKYFSISNNASLFEQNIESSKIYTIFEKIIGTILFISSKYEEIYPPNINVFCKLLGVQKDELLDAEGKILEVIGFSFSTPTIYNFLEGYMQYTDFCSNEEFLSQYLIQLSLQYDQILFHYNSKNSKIAAAALLVVLKLQNYEEQNVWTSSLTHISGYSQKDLLQLAHQIYNNFVYIQQYRKNSSVYKKFSQDAFNNIAIRCKFSEDENQ